MTFAVSKGGPNMNVVITGGSRGIGAAAVRLFARRGDRVWFLYEKNDDAARAVAAETGAQPIRCDVADEARVTEALSAIPDVDVLINNAGICALRPDLPDHAPTVAAASSPSTWTASYHCVRAVLPVDAGPAGTAASSMSRPCGGRSARPVRPPIPRRRALLLAHDEGAGAGAGARAASASTPSRPASF